MRYRPIEERFTEKYEIDPGSGCWNWTGSICRNYGYIRGESRNGTSQTKNFTAHRLSYMLAHGEIPAGMKVLHRCNNQRCVNPAHLKLGTHADNMVDMKKAGSRRGRNAGTTLSPSQIRRMQTLLDKGKTQVQVAYALGVDRTTVQRTVYKGIVTVAQIKKRFLSDEQKSEIVAAVKTGKPILQIAKQFGVDRKTIRNIRDKK